jgi:hypothetical protein
MEPTLHDGGITIGIHRGYSIEEGDVIFIQLEECPERILVKRVIGTPNNWILKNGEPELLLGSDEYFVLGDNRAHSFDSRKFGPIKRREIVGKMILIVY